MRSEIENTATSYFDYLARSFPVMCASDEFDFLPRAETADKYYDCLDNLDPGAIKKHIEIFKDLRQRFNQLKTRSNTIEDKIDTELLISSIEGVLIELEHVESWKHNPLLYLKVGFIGLDHALTKPFDNREEQLERFRARLSQIPRLLRQGTMNLKNIPQTYYMASLSMIDDSNTYLQETFETLCDQKVKNIWNFFREAQKALDIYKNFLISSGYVADQKIKTPTLEMRVKKHFSVRRSLEEIYHIARSEWVKVTRSLEKVSKEIYREKSWQDIYNHYSPVNTSTDTHTLYRNEIMNLRAHILDSGLLGEFPDRSLELSETPTYLRSVRSSASFSAPFSPDIREKAFFYITSEKFHGNKSVHREIVKRLHREFRFLTAHETYPGHHVLDTFRRRSPNMIRRQIESPFFYEGWAYYAESLPLETGYISEPVEVLVDLKRQLWRSARCQIDVGLFTGLLNKEEAVKLLQSANFTREEAISQVNRFGLNPGYQLCYTLGRYEIERLRKTYEPITGATQFHRILLEGGELPFHLAELNLQHKSRN